MAKIARFLLLILCLFNAQAVSAEGFEKLYYNGMSADYFVPLTFKTVSQGVYCDILLNNEALSSLVTIIDQHTKTLDRNFQEPDVRLKLEVPQEDGIRMIYLSDKLIINDNGVGKNFTRHEHRAAFIEALLTILQPDNGCAIDKLDEDYLRSEIKRSSVPY